MKSKLKLTLAVALCLASSQALSLELGHIRVKSALDEPLVAEIPLQLNNLVEAQGLTVSLAPQSDFARVGLSRAGLQSLHFSVQTDTTGHKLILVTSDVPIGDPYLDFLIEVNTRAGKQLREYTVLLDPVIATPAPQVEPAAAAAPTPQPATPAVATPVAPTAATAPAQSSPPPAASVSDMFSAPVQQVPTAVAPAPTPVPVAAPAPPPPAAAPVPPPPIAAATPARSGEYHVAHGDTLYRIADTSRPDAQVSIDQMMLALQRSNPDAFYRDNINALKSGAILRIPSRDSISAMNAAKARARVTKQYEDWHGTAAHKATTVAQSATTPTAAPAAASQAPAKTTDRLALVPPSQGGGAANSHPGEKGGTANAEMAGLKEQLATAQESLTSLKQDNSDLQSRVKDLEDISGKNQKLLGMKDAQIAELQRKLADLQSGNAAASNQATTAAATPVATPESAASTTSAKPTVAVSANANAPTEVAAAATSPTPESVKATSLAKPATETPTHVNAVPPGTPDVLPWYRRAMTWTIAGVVILALILLGLMRRRPRLLPEPGSGTPSLADHFGDSPIPVDSMDESDEAEHPVQTDDSYALPDAAVAAPLAATEPEEFDGFTFDELPGEEHLTEYGIPAAPVVAAPVAGSIPDAAADETVAQEPVFHGEDEFHSPEFAARESGHDDDVTDEHDAPAFSDDPVDTKLDLARAYLDMGDPAGARAMLEEVLNEGSQPQKDEAKRLLEGVS